MLRKIKYRLQRLSAKRGVFVAFLLIGGAAGAASAYAAAVLTYSANTTLNISSPSSIGFVAQSGSVADKIVLNASNFTLVLSSTTGGNFIFKSPLNLNVTTDTGNGTMATSCGSDNVLTVTFANTGNVSTTYTVSVNPGSVPCIYGLNETNGSTGGGSTQVAGGSSNAGGGGGGGGGGGLPAPTTTTTTSPAQPSVVALQAQLNTLLATLQTLMAQAQQKGIKLSPGLIVSSLQKYARDLTLGGQGSDVRQLQNFLISQNIGPMAQQLAKNGASGYFGALTRAALAEYQKSKGITPASGYFGSKTRANVNGQP